MAHGGYVVGNDGGLTLDESNGMLTRFWHVVALTQELRAGHSLKRELYGRPLLLWRDDTGQVYAFDDCCAHRRAPLQVADYNAGIMECPYHGWQYDRQGKLCRVPSDPEFAAQSKCRIPSYSVVEKIWVHMDLSGC